MARALSGALCCALLSSPGWGGAFAHDDDGHPPVPDDPTPRGGDPLLPAVDPAPSLAELKGRLARIVAEEKIPSAALALVAANGVIWVGGLGQSPDPSAAGAAPGPTTTYRAGSLSKLVVALVALRLAEQGRISLEVPVRSLLPDLPLDNPWETTHPLRLAHLLEHTGGLDDLHPSELYARTPMLGLREALSHGAQPRRVRWPPGTRFSYSNPGYALAALVLEKAAGRPFAELAQAEVLGPLGMTTAGYARIAGRELAQGHSGKEKVDYQEIALWPAGALIASAQDLGRLARMLISRGSLDGKAYLSRSSIERMERGRTLPTRALLWHYGFANSIDQEGGFIGHGHEGAIAGFNSELRYYLEEESGRTGSVGYAILVNDSRAEHAVHRLGEEARRYLLRSAAWPKREGPIAATPESLAALAGTFVPLAPRAELLRSLHDLVGAVQVRVKDGALTLQRSFQKPVDLAQTAPGLFRVRGEVLPSLALVSGQGPLDGGRELLVASGSAFPIGGAFQRGSLLWREGLIALLLAALLGMASAILAALLWVPAALRQQGRSAPGLRSRALVLLASLSFALLLLATALSPQRLGEVNATSLAILVLTVLFPALSLAALLEVVLARSQPASPLVRAHSRAVAILCAFVALYLGAYGLWALRLWSA